ncbi:MAG: AI-2E family transporter [Clostridia bacterium]|nr:AI-2E family transporter [Clostridia bacterium]
MKPSWKTCLRITICAFLLYLGIYYLPAAQSVLGRVAAALAPIITGLIIAYILNILMNFYEKHYFPDLQHRSFFRKSKRGVCLFFSILTLLGILILVFSLVIPQLTSCLSILLSEVPPVVDKLLQNASASNFFPQELLSYLQSIDWQKTLSGILDFFINGFGSAAGVLIGAVSTVLSGTFNFIIGIIFALYLLISKDTLLNQLKRLLAVYLPEKWHHRLRHCLHIFNNSFHQYIVGQCKEAVILGSLCMIGMLIFGFPYALMISALIGISALIPIFGAFIGTAIGALMILTISPIKALFFLIFLIVLQQLEGNLIYPRVMGKALELPGIWVFAAVTIGSSLMGFTGLLLGVPTASALYRLLRDDLRSREGTSVTDLSLLHESPISPPPKKKKSKR